MKSLMRKPDAGGWMLDTGCSMLDARCGSAVPQMHVRYGGQPCIRRLPFPGGFVLAGLATRAPDVRLFCLPKQTTGSSVCGLLRQRTAPIQEWRVVASQRRTLRKTARYKNGVLLPRKDGHSKRQPDTRTAAVLAKTDTQLDSPIQASQNAHSARLQ